MEEELFDENGSFSLWRGTCGNYGRLGMTERMITIEKGHEEYSRLLIPRGNQKMRYIPSRFFLREETADGELVCNTLTGELALLSAAEADFMKQDPLTYRPEMERLIRSRFLVPEDSTESRTVDELRALQLRRRAAKRIITQYNILPTTCCNARCFYCYESGLQQIHMTEEIAEQLASISRTIAAGNV